MAFAMAPASHSPNVKKGGIAAYYDTMLVCLASLRRWNPGVEVLLFCDHAPPSSFVQELQRLRVTVEHVPFTHKPPDGMWPTFSASLYTLDVLHRISVDENPSRLLLLDPDVLCTSRIDGLLDRIHPGRPLVYPTGFPPDESSQGLTADQAAVLHQMLDPALDSFAPAHYGGELYGLASEDLPRLLLKAEEAWTLSLERYQSRRGSYFVTEEHLLNFALRYFNPTSAHDAIRRIWTAPRFRNATKDDADLLLWHLPSEKSRGFPGLLEFSTDAASWFWTADSAEFRSRCARHLGLARRPFPRFLKDSLGALRQHVRLRAL